MYKEKKDHPLANLSNIIEYINGAIFSIIIIQTFLLFDTNIKNLFDLPNSPPSKEKIWALILLLIFFIEDYISVKIVNFYKNYGTVTRFGLDILISISFFISFELMFIDKKEFMFYLIITYSLGIIWVMGFWIRGTLKDIKGSRFLGSTIIIHASMAIFLGIFYLVYNFNHINYNIKDLFEYFIYMFFIVHIIFSGIYKFLVLKKNNLITADIFLIKNTGLFTSRFLAHLIIFIISLKKIFLLLKKYIFKPSISKIDWRKFWDEFSKIS